MHARYIKITLWVVALVVAWKLGQSYTVTNALFVFAAAGVVPGTDVTLAPNQVLAVLAAVFLLAVLLIFGTNILRGARALAAWWRTLYNPAEPALALESQAGRALAVGVVLASVASVEPLSANPATKSRRKPQPVVIIEPPRRFNKTLLLLHVAGGMLAVGTRAIVIRLQSRVPRLMTFATRVWAAVVVWLKHATMWVSATARAYWRQGVHVVRLALEAARRVVIRFAVAMCRGAIRFWSWLEPYLRRFDAWLGLRYHAGLAAIQRNETVKLFVNFGREAAKVAVNIRSELRAALSRFAEK